MGQFWRGVSRELYPPFQQPTRQIGGQLTRPVFELVEGRRLRFGGGGEEPSKKSVGVFMPLLAELLAVRCRRGGHRDTFLG